MKFINKRKFFKELATFSAAELNAFYDFAQSPFLKLSKQTIGILRISLRHHPLFEVSEATFISVAKKEFDLDANRLNWHLHQLSNVVKKWLQWQVVENDEIVQQELLVKSYKQRFQVQAFFKESEQLTALIRAKPKPSYASCLQLYQAYSGIFYHNQTPKYKANVNSLAELENNLDLYYQYIKLRLLCQKLSRSTFLTTVVEKEAQQELTDFAATHSAVPFFRFCHNFIDYTTQPTEQSLDQMIADFRLLNEEMSTEDRTFCMSLTINALTKESMNGNPKVRALYYTMLKYNFSEGLAIHDGEIRDSLLNNFILAGCQLGKFKEAKVHLKKYSPYLNDANKEHLVQLLSCSILYHQGKLKEVEAQLDQFRFKHLGMKIRVKNMHAKCLYELYESDPSYKSLLQTNLLNFRRFLNKQTDLQNNRKQQYLNLIGVIRKMVFAYEKRSHQRRKLKHELLAFVKNDDHAIMSKFWLIKMLEQWD